MLDRCGQAEIRPRNCSACDMLLISFFKVKVLLTTVVMKYSYGQTPYSYYSYIHFMYAVNQSILILQGWTVEDTTTFLLGLMCLNAPVP